MSGPAGVVAKEVKAESKAAAPVASPSPCTTCVDRAPLWTEAVDPAARLFPKLYVSGPGDATEREADRVAEHVARSPTGDCGCGGSGGACECPDVVQRAASTTSVSGGVSVGEAPPVVHQALASVGSPLDAGVRREFEPRLQTDLSHVRVHNDALAASSAHAVAAKAYTVGSHVVFGSGHYQPGTSSGRFLLAHELAHVVQQRGRRPLVQRAVLDSVVFEPLPQRRDPSACLVHLHGEERNALRTAQNLVGRCNVNLVHLNTTTRHLRVEALGHRCGIDPNRIFSDPGLEASWDDVNRARPACKTSPVRAEGIRQVQEFRNNLLVPAILQCRGMPSTPGELSFELLALLLTGSSRLSRTTPVVAFHNNSAGRLNINWYCTNTATPGCSRVGRFAGETDTTRLPSGTANPHIESGQDPDDFILVTQPVDFTALAALNRNVVLQKLNPPDDGSLSVAMASERYVNVEAETGTPLSRNITMGEEALRQVGATCGAAVPRPRPRRGTPVTGRWSSADLSSGLGGVPDVFTRRVYDLAVGIVRGQGRPYVGSVPAGDLRVVRGQRVHRDIVSDLTGMLTAADTALAAARSAGDPDAANESGIRVVSGYRDALRQFEIWKTEYASRYLAQTRAARQALPGGEFSEAAAQHMAAFVAARVFPGGYSSHQEGRTVDLSITKNRVVLQALTAQVASWKATWFFNWLMANASRFNFAQNTSIDEPWHWEWTAPAAPAGTSTGSGSGAPPTP